MFACLEDPVCGPNFCACWCIRQTSEDSEFTSVYDRIHANVAGNSQTATDARAGRDESYSNNPAETTKLPNRVEGETHFQEREINEVKAVGKSEEWLSLMFGQFGRGC